MDHERVPDAADLVAHAGFVSALARSILRDPDRADDVAQDTWVVALDRPPRDRDRMRGWLAGVVRNLARMKRRTAARRDARQRLVASDRTAPPAAEVVARLELQRRLVDQVLTLDEPYRTTIVLRYFDGLSPREIATRMDAPLATVHTRLRRARAVLRAEYADRDGNSWSTGLAVLAGLSGGPSSAPAIATGVVAMTAKAKLTVGAVSALVVLLALGSILIGWSEDAPESAGARTDRAEGAAAPAASGAEPGRSGADVVGAAPEPPDAERRLRIVVVDARGLPAAGASLRFIPESGEDRHAAADAGGRATMTVEGAGRLVVRHRDHAPKLVSVVEPPREDGASVRVVLETGLTIAGRVLDPDGLPVRNARIRVRPVEAEDWRPRLGLSVRSGPDGQFELRGLLAGSYRIVLRPKGKLAARPPSPAPVVEAGDRAVVIRLKIPARLRIRLVDAASGEPVRTETATTFIEEDGERLALWSQERAALDLEPPLGRRLGIRVEALGYRPAVIPEVLLKPGEEGREIELKLESDPSSVATLILSLSDDRGAPITRFRLVRHVVLEGVSVGSSQVLESANGRYSRIVPPGKNSLSVEPCGEDRDEPDFIQRRIVESFEAGRVRELKITLTRGASLMVTYPPDTEALEGGAILSRSGVTVCYEDGGRLPRRSRRSGKPHSGVRLFSGLPAGRVRVNLRRGDGRRSERLVDLRAGETTKVVFPDD